MQAARAYSWYHLEHFEHYRVLAKLDLERRAG
jgi:hypothetical protein